MKSIEPEDAAVTQDVSDDEHERPDVQKMDVMEEQVEEHVA